MQIGDYSHVGFGDGNLVMLLISSLHFAPAVQI